MTMGKQAVVLAALALAGPAAAQVTAQQVQAERQQAVAQMMQMTAGGHIMGLQACITKNRQPETELRKLPGWVTGPPWTYMSLADLFGGVPAGCGELVRLLIVDCFESERAL